MKDTKKYESAQKKVKKIRSNCQIAEYAFKVSEKESDELILIIKKCGQSLGGKKVMTMEHPAMAAAFILTNTVNVKLYKKVKAFLKEKPDIDNGIYHRLKNNLTKMSGY